MRKSRLILIGVLSLLLIIGAVVALLYLYGFYISRPHYDAEYFTQEYLSKYSSPEDTYDHFLSAWISGNADYYQEVLGRRMTEYERGLFKPYKEKRPKIVAQEKRKNSVFVITEYNEGWFFERVNGRWVFTPEDLGANIRGLFEHYF